MLKRKDKCHDNAHDRLDDIARDRRLADPKTPGQQYFDDIIDSLRRPENNYGQAYSQDFIRRYYPRR